MDSIDFFRNRSEQREVEARSENVWISTFGAGASTSRSAVGSERSLILIFRIGSLGDMLVSLPALHTVAQAYPNAKRVLLTNLPLGIGNKEIRAGSLLDGAGLVHEYINYAPNPSLRALFALANLLRGYKFDRLIYLTPRRSVAQLLRDEAFFRLAGIRSIVGLNYSRKYHTYGYDAAAGRFEHEGARLVRNLRSLTPASLTDANSWSLHLSSQEKSSVSERLSGFVGRDRYLVASIGTKVEVKDWGEANWAEWAESVSSARRDLGLIAIGSADEFVASERIAAHWAGPVLNLCGMLTPRESACVIADAEAFVGHDSGPMHLAAAVGAACVAIFSAREKPGIWFPYGTQHHVLYKQTECFGCRLDTCVRHRKKCIAAIKPAEVIAATLDLLGDVSPANPVMFSVSKSAEGGNGRRRVVPSHQSGGI
jgi:heptosyltransferase III